MKQIIIALLLSSASAIRLQTEKIYPIYGNSRLYKKEVLDYWHDIWEENKKNPKQFWTIASAPRIESESFRDREPGRNRFHDLSMNALSQQGQNAYWWNNGNGGGSEKWDAFEEIARFSPNQKAFYEGARQPWIRSQNERDPVASYNTFHRRSEGQSLAAANQQAGWWNNGNGGGSEKWDAFEEIARFSPNQKTFYERSRQPWIRSQNERDREATYNTFHRRSEGQSLAAADADAEWWTNGNGAGSEKWDAFDEIGRFSKNKKEFYEGARQPWLASENKRDKEPSHNIFHVRSGPQSFAEAGADAGWWTNGNGAGSEKWDAFEEIARFSKNKKEFNEGARQPWLASENKKDKEPTHNIFHTRSGGQSLAATEADAGWWTNGNGAGSEKWDAFEEIARFSKNKKEFYEGARQPWLASENKRDKQPSHNIFHLRSGPQSFAQAYLDQPVHRNGQDLKYVPYARIEHYNGETPLPSMNDNDVAY